MMMMRMRMMRMRMRKRRRTMILTVNMTVSMGTMTMSPAFVHCFALHAGCSLSVEHSGSMIFLASDVHVLSRLSTGWIGLVQTVARDKTSEYVPG